MLMHFRGNMDFWDPLLINTLSRSRPVLLLDNAGIGASAGEIPTTLHGWADHVVALLHALHIPRVDLLGFSMGGGAAQHVVLAAPRGMIRRLVLAGTRTSFNPTTVIGDRAIFYPLATSVTEGDFKTAWTESFFPHTEAGRAAADAVWERIQHGRRDRIPHLSVMKAKRQVEAFVKFSTPGAGYPYERIQAGGEEWELPVLVANGDDDLLIPTCNSASLVGMLKDARLKIYEDAGHGFLFQYAERFGGDVKEFLDGEEKETVKARLS
jgi:pimeloyl-ACP methyl ester carboxylesterase